MGLKRLTVEEEKEEEFEINELEKEYKEFIKINEVNPIEEELVGEKENLCNMILFDMYKAYFRSFIKYSFVMKHNLKQERESQSKKLPRISASTLKNTELIKGETATKVKGNISFLKTSLQEAGQLRLLLKRTR